ncbi:cyclic nucleotide-binding domain-containing protein [bacterium]|nr:cyclic nucleotide-binding domain-containing protein [bacterium]
MDAERLKRVPIFSSIEDGILNDLAGIVEEKSYEAGGTVFQEGDAGDAMYVILEGAVKIVKVIDPVKGLSKDLAILSAGDFFGEMSLIDKSPRSASVVAVGAAKLGRVSGQGFSDLLQKSAITAANLLFGIIQTVSGRLRQTNTELVTLYETGKTVGEAEQLQDIVDVVFKRLLLTAGASRGMFVLRNELAGGFEVRASEGFPAGSDALARTVGDHGLIGRVLKDGAAVLISDIDADERFAKDDREGYESASMMLVPLCAEERVLGVLVYGHTDKSRFSPNHLNLCLGVAAQTAQAILNARHREEEAARTKLHRHYIKF